MKKSIICSVAALAASVLVSGCASVGTNNGAPTAGIGSLFTEMKGNAMIQPVSTDDYTVLAHNVQGKGEMTNVFMLVAFGDMSYATLKADAIRSVPGADDIIDAKIDYACKNILGINKVTATMTGTAIKYKK